MYQQNGFAFKCFSNLIHIYSQLRLSIESLISWSPFLVRVFNETLTIRRWKVFQFFLRKVGHALPNPIIVNGHVLHHSPTDCITTLAFERDHDIGVEEAIKEYLKPGMTVIDAGANIGYFTLIAARLVGPHGHVYAFEPVPTTAELLRKNIEINGYSDRVTVIQKALTDNASMVRIYLDDLALGISSIMANKQSNNYVDVESISLDGFFREKSWPQIHLVKMDIEGAEKLALNGMKALCRRNPRLSLIIEVNLRFNVNELFDALLACGFSRFYLLEDHSRLINIPQDIPQIISVSQGILVNLLCKKAG